jgi:hypothetical protein
MLTTRDAFAESTALVLDIFIDKALAETPHTLTAAQIEWFRGHCDQRFRWFHANNATWRKWLEDRDRRIDPRDQSLVWIRHWLTAFVKDPERFQQIANHTQYV